MLSNTFNGAERKELPSQERRSWDRAVRALLQRHLTNTLSSFWFQEAPSLSCRDVWFPRQLCQTCCTKPALHAYTYVHAPCACATPPDIHTQAGTHKHTFPMAKKLSGAFFKQGYSLLLREADFRTGAGRLWCKSNYSNAEKPFRRHGKISSVQLVMSV